MSEKAKRKGVAVGIIYEIGVTLGLVKPYYLDIIYRVDGQPYGEVIATKYTEETKDIFLDPTNIQGYTGFFKGWGEISAIPGAQGKLAVHFAWGAYEKFVRALDVGVMVELYAKSVPIMVIEDNKPYFINLYLNLQLGKRK